MRLQIEPKKAQEMRCFGYTTSPEDDCRGTVLVVRQFWLCFYRPVLALFLAVSRTVGGTETVGLLGRAPELKYISQRALIGLSSLSFLQVMHVYQSCVSQNIIIFAFCYQSICDLLSGLFLQYRKKNSSIDPLFVTRTKTTLCSNCKLTVCDCPSHCVFQTLRCLANRRVTRRLC